MFLWLWLSVASAQSIEPSASHGEAYTPAQQCADAARGREIDVCLRLAAEHSQHTDSIAAALRAHVDRAADADRELLGALLMLLTEESGVEGARRLGALGDPRAVAPLAHAGETRHEPVASAAVAALAHHEGGLQPLTRWVADRSTPTPVRVAAAHALADAAAPAGADVLVATLRGRRVPPPLRVAMYDALERAFPERLAELDRQVGRDGTWWLAGGGAVALGFGLGVVGHLGRGELAGLGVVTGAAAGGTAGWAIGRTWPMEASDAAFLTTTGTLGTASGAILGSAIFDDRTRGAWLGGLAGEAVGFSLGVGLRKLHGGTTLDSIEAASSAALLAVAAGNLTRVATLGRTNGRPEALASGIGLGVGTAIGHVVAPRIDLVPRHGWMLLLGAIYGGGMGALGSFDTPSALPAGAALGALTAYGLSAAMRPRGDVLFGAYSGMALGSVIGAGAGVLADPRGTSSGRAWRIGAMSGATLGLGVGAWSAWRTVEPLNGNDVLFTSMVTGWATWQATGWYAFTTPPPAVSGLFLMAPAVAGGATALLSPMIDVEPIWTFSALSFGLLGGYIGGTSAQLAGGGRRILPATLIASNAGLGLGFLFAAPPIRISPLVLALGDAGAVLGGSTAALVTTFFVDPGSRGGVETVLAGSLVGLGVGFAGGAILGGVLHRKGKSRDLAWRPLGPLAVPGEWALAPAVLPGRDGPAYGGVLQVRGW